MGEPKRRSFKGKRVVPEGRAAASSTGSIKPVDTSAPNEASGEHSVSTVQATQPQHREYGVPSAPQDREYGMSTANQPREYGVPSVVTVDTRAEDNAYQDALAAEGQSEEQGERTAASAEMDTEASEHSRRTRTSARASGHTKKQGQGGQGKSKALITIKILAVLLLLLFVASCTLFVWHHWFRFDDAADFQGTWYAQNSETALSFTDNTLELSEDVTYEYTLDANAKTLHYTFGQMEGQGRYYLSADRQSLVITDGEFSFWDTALADIPQSFEALVAFVQGRPETLPASDASIVLTRTPSADAAHS